MLQSLIKLYVSNDNNYPVLTPEPQISVRGALLPPHRPKKFSNNTFKLNLLFYQFFLPKSLQILGDIQYPPTLPRGLLPTIGHK